MKYVLDTDIASYFFKRDEAVRKRFIQVAVDSRNSIAITIFTHSEMIYGYHFTSMQNPQTYSPEGFLSTLKMLEYTKEASDTYAKIKSELRSHGNLIEDMDILIASVVLTNKAVLVTNNTRDFSRIEGLKIENWKQ